MANCNHPKFTSDQKLKLNQLITDHLEQIRSDPSKSLDDIFAWGAILDQIIPEDVIQPDAPTGAAPTKKTKRAYTRRAVAPPVTPPAPPTDGPEQDAGGTL